MKVEDGEEITYEMASDAMKRGAYFLEAIQASDGHWPSETSGPLFYLCPLLICMYIMGFMDSAFSPEHKKEMMRYLYNHQVAIKFKLHWLLLSVFDKCPRIMCSLLGSFP